MSEKVKADWEGVERDYRAGVLSIREIAKINSISEGAVRKKAKEKFWERDLSSKVAQKVRTELVRTEVRTADPQTEREIVEVAAATVVQVVRSHRQRISQGSALVELLTKQLMDVAGSRELFELEIKSETEDDSNNSRRSKLMSAVSLEKHASIATNLANATKTWVSLERQAFGLKDGAETLASDVSDDQIDARLHDLLNR